MNNAEIDSQTWPTLPLQRPITKESKYFRFKNKHLYLDIPNPSITNIYEEILNKCENLSDEDLAYKCAEDIVNGANLRLSNYFNKFKENDSNVEVFFRLTIQKNKNSNKHILFGYYLNWKKFSSFIDCFSKSDKISLEEKYRYISSCKYSGSELSSNTILLFRDANGILDNDANKEFREKFNSSIDMTLISIHNTLDGLISFLTKKLKDGKRNNYGSFILDFIPDIITELDAIKLLSKNGFISSCYREIRSLVERMSWVILEEYLELNSFKLWNIENKELPAPLLNINSKWRESDQKQNLLKITDLIPVNIKPPLNNNQKSKLIKLLLKNMSIEMYVALAGKPSNDCNNSKIPFLDINLIRKGIDEVAECIQNQNYLENISNEVINNLRQKWENSLCGDFPFPTSNFIFEFLNKIFDKKLDAIQSVWHRYSLFIHPYLFTWEVLSNTSVIEYKIFEHELQNPEKIIEIELESLFEHLSELKKKTNHNT
jgi:hypothetical protein